MIRTYFGIDQDPFHPSNVELLPSQDEILSTLRVHCQQGGLCVVVGEPGTGKSIIKHALQELDSKMLLTPTVNRTLHTYHSVLRILCEAFNITTDGRDFKCETRLIEQADKINKQGKMLAPIIDDAHLMNVDAIRRLRLVFEDFPLCLSEQHPQPHPHRPAKWSCSRSSIWLSTTTSEAASPTPFCYKS